MTGLSQASSPGRPALFIYVLLGVILATGFWLRYSRADVDGLSFDEQMHVELSTGIGSLHMRLPQDVLIPDAPPLTMPIDAQPWHAVWSHMDRVTHPPMYMIFLRLWRATFGPGDLAAKMSSVFCALAAALVLFQAVRLSTGTSAALWAAAIFCVAPTQVYLGQQVRGYAMTQLWGCALLLTIVRLERDGLSTGRLIALGSFTLALPLTHYLAVFADAAAAAYILIRWPLKKLRVAISVMILAGVVYLSAWGPFMWKQRNEVSDAADPFLVETTNRTAADRVLLTLGRAAAIPVRQIAEPNPEAMLWLIWTGGALLIGSAVVAFRRRRSDLILWIFWIGGTLGAIMLLDLFRSTRQLVFIRYTSLATPAIVAMWASVFHHTHATRRWLNHLLPATGLLFALALSNTAYTRFGEGEWAALGNFIREKVRPGDTLIFSPGSQPAWFAQIEYLAATHYAAETFPRPAIILSRPADPKLLRTLPDGSAWAIIGATDRPLGDILPGVSIDESYELPDLSITCAHVRVPRPD